MREVTVINQGEGYRKSGVWVDGGEKTKPIRLTSGHSLTTVTEVCGVVRHLQNSRRSQSLIKVRGIGKSGCGWTGERKQNQYARLLGTV